jgi:hypothetical protein
MAPCPVAQIVSLLWTYVLLALANGGKGCSAASTDVLLLSCFPLSSWPCTPCSARAPPPCALQSSLEACCVIAAGMDTMNVVADRSWLRVGAREGIVTIMLHPAGGAP